MRRVVFYAAAVGLLLVLEPQPIQAATINAILAPGTLGVGDSFEIEISLDLGANEEASVFEARFDLLGLEHVSDITLSEGGETWDLSVGNFLDSQALLSLTSANTGGIRQVAVLSGTLSAPGPFGVTLAPGTIVQKDLAGPPFIEDVVLETMPGTLLAGFGDLSELLAPAEPEPVEPTPSPTPEPLPEPDPDPGIDPTLEPNPAPDPVPEPPSEPEPVPAPEPAPEPQPEPPPPSVDPGVLGDKSLDECDLDFVTASTGVLVDAANVTSDESGNGLFFFAANDGENGEELWRSDGTLDGTVLVKDIAPGPASSWPRELTNVDGTLFFRANDTIHGMELWRSNGTAEGTTLVKDIAPGEMDSSPRELTKLGGDLTFEACDPTDGCGFWISDGTEVCTRLLHEVHRDALTLAPIALQITEPLLVSDFAKWEDDDSIATAGGKKVITTGSATTESLAEKIVEHLSSAETDGGQQNFQDNVAQIAEDGPLLSYSLAIDLDAGGPVDRDLPTASETPASVETSTAMAGSTPPMRA
jgi:ELWxxDGT repeat protein